MEAKPMTGQQANVLAAVWQYWREYGIGPTLREIADGFEWNVNNAVNHLKSLEKMGLIEWTRGGKSRQIWPAGLRQAIQKVAGDSETGSPATLAG